MAEKKYRIKLSEEERKELKAVVASKAAVSKRHRAQILLCADENHKEGGMKDRDIARAVGVSVPSVERTRCALAEHGLQIAVHGWPAHRKEPRGKLDGWAEAHLVVASCSPPPEGASRWTLKLLGEHLVKLELVDEISVQTVSRALKKRTEALAHRTVVPAA
jgi:transposase